MKLPQFISIILTALLSSSHAIATERPPNFIFILSDDIAQGALGSYGQELIKTPRLDQMAAEGTRYMQAYCGTTERRKTRWAPKIAHHLNSENCIFLISLAQ